MILWIVLHHKCISAISLSGPGDIFRDYSVIGSKKYWNILEIRKTDLWNKFFQDGEVDAKEFADAVKKNCMNKPFAEMPEAFKTFISGAFKSIDVDGNFYERKIEKR